MSSIFKYLLCFFLWSSLVFADYSSSYRKLKPLDRDVVDRVNDYFNNLKTLKANFLQFSDMDGSSAEGILYMARPSKLRFEYKVPSEIIIITNRNKTLYYDVELEERNMVKTSDIPIALLLKDSRDLKDMKFTILKVLRSGKKITVRTRSLATAEMESQVVEFTFDDDITTLQEIKFKASDGNSMLISFFKVERPEKLDAKLFDLGSME